MDETKKLTCDEIYEKFLAWSPEHATMVKAHGPWGSTSIVIWLYNGMAYKVKYIADDKFIMQVITKADIDKKFKWTGGKQDEHN